MAVAMATCLLSTTSILTSAEQLPSPRQVAHPGTGVGEGKQRGRALHLFFQVPCQPRHMKRLCRFQTLVPQPVRLPCRGSEKICPCSLRRDFLCQRAAPGQWGNCVTSVSRSDKPTGRDARDTYTARRKGSWDPSKHRSAKLRLPEKPVLDDALVQHAQNHPSDSSPNRVIE